MLKTHEKFRLTGEGNGKEFFAEVNWSDDAAVKDCQIVKFTFPGEKGDTYVIVKKEHLLSMIFTMGTPEEQQNLIPQTLMTHRRFEGVVRMKATKDIMKGEEIVTRCFHDIPGSFEEVIGPVRGKGDSPIVLAK